MSPESLLAEHFASRLVHAGQIGIANSEEKKMKSTIANSRVFILGSALAIALGASNSPRASSPYGRFRRLSYLAGHGCELF
jgi:hypothetical protein